MRQGQDSNGEQGRRERAEMRLRTYLAVNAELAGANSLPAAAPGLLEVLGRNLGWEMAALWRVDADAGLIRCIDVWHLPDTGLIGFSLATRHAEFARGDGLPGRVWETAAPLWVPDVVAQPGGPRTPSAAREQVRAALAMPITTADGVVGVIELFGAGSAEPPPDMLELLSGIAAMVGQFIRRRDAERRLRAGEALKSAILNAAFECIIGVDAHGGVIEFNPSAVNTFGIEREDAYAMSIGDLLDVASLDNATRGLFETLLAGGEPELLGQPFEAIAVRADGTRFPVEMAVMRIDLPGPPSFTISLRDISANRRAQEAVRHLAAIVESSTDAIMSTTLDGTVLTWNAGAEQLYGYPASEVVGRDSSVLAPPDRPDEIPNLLVRVAHGERVPQFDSVRMRRDGTLVDVAVSLSPIVDEDGAIVAASTIVRDISDRKRAEAQIAHLAYHDQLTGLPNRAMFHEHLELALARADRNQCGVAVLFIDLDNFKLINDSFGHEAGDELLRDFGARLSAVIRATDIVARQGGDEFLVLVPDLELESEGAEIVPRALEVVAAIEHKVRSVLETPFEVAGTDVHIGLSIGVSIYPIDAADRDALLRNADTAMYIGKGLIDTATVPEARTSARGRLALLADLRRAVEQQEFELYYQPIYQLDGRRMVGAEALIRWRDPHDNLILPEQFIPLAERSGLIEPITRMVIDGACRQAREWTDQGADLVVTFNLSPGLWGPSIVETLLEATGRAGVEPHRMMIEVTESTVMVQPVRASRTISLLREHGVRLAIDDFGKGHSSLERLRELPVTTVKIDRSFVSDLPRDRGAAAIAATIIKLAHSLGLQPLAEGIETQEQLDFLLAAGCELGQGYLLGRPVPAPELALAG
jgi:diguanylate cyclase (GGDEF)-like protein/PAS domain S-box-containing protein